MTQLVCSDLRTALAIFSWKGYRRVSGQARIVICS